MILETFSNLNDCMTQILDSHWGHIHVLRALDWLHFSIAMASCAVGNTY